MPVSNVAKGIQKDVNQESVNQNEVIQNEVIDKDKLILLLEEVIEDLAGYDADSVVKFEFINKSLKGTIYKTEIAQIETAMENYEFEEAEKLCKKLMQKLEIQ